MAENIKIIIAEDNDIQRAYFARLIEKLGYQAVPAKDGLEALEILKAEDAHIIISDCEMPKLNGIDLAREVRKLALDHYVHIILITGYNDDAFWPEAMAAGADDFLIKTSGTATLRARIRAATRLINHEMKLAEQARVLKETHERINADLLAAASAQRQLLPNLKDCFPGFKIASAFVPSSIVSGDMFGCFQLNEKLLGFYTVDVSGHGVHASLLSVAIGHLITREFFETKAFDKDGAPNPAALVTDLNQRFSGTENDDYFTMFCGAINIETGQVVYCQAGAPSPFYVNKNGMSDYIGDGGFPVGMLPEVTYENNAFVIEEGGILILCSDAASEAENRQFQQFGHDRLKSVIGETFRDGVVELPEKIIKALTEWTEMTNLEDDLTIVALERT